ncbi:DUF4374 domain-containing protein [Geofilum rubicundum]|uniref:DUF4374 domain-containing protein n=1 Tax=Geofilum rubicundum JCM 15548 TaxID=1236989 RepID=A0A0E9M259_9BACT|nr:DUF4374 domain-containing protein [Geofilum rubicundum]GAO31683.1 hypothetical protein JCM15548_14072 [Geofilum rubicundum JCM 15548]
MKKFKKFSLLLISSLLFGGSLLLSSCSEDDNKTDEFQGEDAFALSLAYQGTDGNFTYYTVKFEDVMSGSLSAFGKGIDQLGYFTYNQIGDKIYSIGGMGTNSLIGLENDANGDLYETGGISSFDNSLNDVVETEDGKLLGVEISSTSDVVVLHTLDAASLTVNATSTTAVSNLTSASGPSFSGMVQSGNYVYLSYYISDPATYATNHTDVAQVAVFSYPELEFVKIIEDTRTGPIGGFGTHSGLIKDESGNVYALSHSNPANGFSQFTKEAAILRINSGATEFDPDYFFAFDEVAEGKTTAHLLYLGNGKVLAEMNMKARADQSTWSDSPLKPAILDLNVQTIDYIDEVPEHSGLGRKLASTALHDGNYVYMCIPEDVSLYVYRINLQDYTAVKGAEVEANFVAGFFKL